jgi:BMFP domain-containing protein YqiC
MNRMLKIAFGAVLGTALMAGAVAQNFPDVPEYHWVWDALLNMKNEGILVGYPDGLYRPGRPASRAELAAAVNSAYEKLRGMINGLQNQVDTLNRKIGDVERGLANKADRSELAALRDALNALKADVDTIKGWKRIIDDLQRLSDLFREELREIRGDVDAMKSDLADLGRRVTALEGRKPAVDIHGDVNLISIMGQLTISSVSPLTDARPDSAAATTSLSR